MKRKFKMLHLNRKIVGPVFAATIMALLVLVMSACGSLSGASTLSDSLANTSKQSDHQSGMSYNFQTLDNNADRTFNQLLGINNDGKIAGYFGSGTVVNGTLHPNKGYTLSRPYQQNNYHNENFLDSVQTQVTAINNQGNTAGFWVDGNGNNFGFVEWNGFFIPFQGPDTPAPATSSSTTPSFTQLLGLNDKGIAVGFDNSYVNTNGTITTVSHGFMLDLNKKGGKFTAIAFPTGASSLTATAINDNGDVAGFYVDSNNNTDGFLLKGNTFTTFRYPISSRTSATSTMFLGINKYDQIVGTYVDSNNQTRGFLLTSPLLHMQWQTIDDPKGINNGKTFSGIGDNGTTVNGINDNGQLVGFYVDSKGNTDGFLATP